jgi:hypothetical protein
MPLGDPRRGDFFAAPATVDEGASATEDGSLGPLPNVATAAAARSRQRQHTAPTSSGFFQVDTVPSGGTTPARRSGRKKTNSFMAGLLARRAVGLDLLPSEEAELGVYEFFRRPEEELPTMPEGEAAEETKEEIAEEGEVVSDESFREQADVKVKPKLFKPLVFAPRVVPKVGGHGHGGVGHSVALPTPKEEAPTEVVMTTDGEMGESPVKEEYEEEAADDEAAELLEKFDDSHIIRATKKDYFFTAMLFLVMSALVGVVWGWHTHLDESDSIFGPVGLAW